MDGRASLLLSALAESAAEGKTEDADALCERIFLTKDARQTDDNLSFVRNRLLHGGGEKGSDLSALLDRYRRIRAGKKIRDDETDPVCVTLQLSGVVKTVFTGDGRNLVTSGKTEVRVWNLAPEPL